MSSSYYNIDDILAEDVLVPVTNVVDFSHLAHLDPDYIHRPIPVELESSLEEDDNETEEQKLELAQKRARNRRIQQDYFLPEGSRIKMPLWAIEKWCMLGYVRVGIPRHYGRKIRERLIADPVAINLRNKDEYFFLAGSKVVALIIRCSVASATAASTRSNSAYAQHAAIMASVAKDAEEVKQTLLIAHTGERLRQIFDWTLTSIDDDVSSFTKKLTEMEMDLFLAGSAASNAAASWKIYGSRRIIVSKAALRERLARKRASMTATPEMPRVGRARMVSPDHLVPIGGLSSTKRSRTL